MRDIHLRHTNLRRSRLGWSNFHKGALYHIEISPLICAANQWTGFYMIETYVIKELTHLFPSYICIRYENIGKL